MVVCKMQWVKSAPLSVLSLSFEYVICHTGRIAIYLVVWLRKKKDIYRFMIAESSVSLLLKLEQNDILVHHNLIEKNEFSNLLELFW